MTSRAIEETNGMTATALVSIVDDDESVREALPDLLREFGFAVQAFASAEEFLESGWVGETRCLVLDIAMPGMSGIDLQRELTRRSQALPIVFITANEDSSDCARILDAGDASCLIKPFTGMALLHAVTKAIQAG
jgi:FixJ family two-component response regulator